MTDPYPLHYFFIEDIIFHHSELISRVIACALFELWISDLVKYDVSSSRNMSRNKVLGLATGEVFLGKEAYENGLVDVLGGFKEAEALAEELAGEELSLIRYSKPVSLLEKLMSSMSVSNYWVGRGLGDSIIPETGIFAK